MNVPRHLHSYPIPCHPGHDVVYGLAAGPGNEVYLAASNEFYPGLCAAVFAFEPSGKSFRQVIDIERLTGFDPKSGQMPHCKVHLALNSTPEGRVFAATHFTAPGVGQTDFEAIAAYRRNYPGCFLLEYDPAEDRAFSHGRLLEGEGARISCLDAANNQYYFLSYPRGHLFRYDYQKRSLHDLGRIGQENAFGLEVDDEGNVYTSDDLGQIVCYSFKRDRLEATDLYLPLQPGRGPRGNYIRRMARGGDGCFYGFTNKGTRLFRIDPRQRSLEDLGVIYGEEGIVGRTYPHLPPAKAVVGVGTHSLFVAFGGDGVYLDTDPVPNLVEYDLRTRRIVDWGKLANPADGMPSWIPQCALYQPGTQSLYVGLQQTVGQLCLWQLDLSQKQETLARPSGQLSERHVETINAKPFGASVEGNNQLPFVRRGSVNLIELGWRGEDRLIPAEETAIGDLLFDNERTLYGVTCGRRSHLFVYHPYQQTRFTENYEVHPWDLGIVADEPTLRAKLFRDPTQRRLLIATEHANHIALHGFTMGSENKRYRGAYHSPTHWPAIDWDTPPFSPSPRLPNAPGVFDNLHYLPQCRQFVTLDANGAVTATGAPIARDNTAVPSVRFVALFRSSGDHLMGLTAEGICLDLAWNEGRASALAQRVALGKHAITSFAASPLNARQVAWGAHGLVLIHGEDSSASPRAVSLPNAWKVRALAWHPSGWIYGFYGEDHAIGEAFAINPRTGSVREFGILQVSSEPRYWMLHRADAIAIGARGEVYFGEHDRLAHLFALRDDAME